jgi:hypothetical protein
MRKREKTRERDKEIERVNQKRWRRDRRMGG